MHRSCVAAAGWVLLLGGVAFAQSPRDLVNRMVQNELAAAKNDHSQWMYRDKNSQRGTTRVEEVVGTPEGSMRRLISVNGKPATADQEKRSQQDIQKFLTDPNYRKQQREKTERDAKKATELLAMLPNAFLYSASGREGDTIRLAFRPNPKFSPPSREAKVFHAMEGMLLIDAKQMRLGKLSGHRLQNVDFGGGILAKLKKGGTFEVDQADVGGGHWEITRLTTHISGRALFFATITQQQDETMSDFREVPAGTNLAKAAELLKEIPAVASLQKH